MMIALLLAGIGALLAGLLAIGYGILLELSLGNSLIVAGTVAASSGLIVLGLAAVVAELKLVARRLLDPRVAAEARVRSVLPALSQSTAPAPSAPEGGFLFSRDQPAETAGSATVAAPMSPPPWEDETAARAREAAPAEPAPAEPAPKRRNLMFSSTMRRDRERAQQRAAEPASGEPRIAPPQESESPPASFEDAWPKTERARIGEIQRRSSRAPSTLAEADSGAAEPPPPAPRSEDQPAVTVLKSGVVDGMAYTLYSDGSIEAQMPEGMMRFASLDELTAHIERRS